MAVKLASEVGHRMTRPDHLVSTVAGNVDLSAVAGQHLPQVGQPGRRSQQRIRLINHGRREVQVGEHRWILGSADDYVL